MIDESNNQNMVIRSPLFTLLHMQLDNAIEQRDVQSIILQLKALLFSVSPDEQAPLWAEFLPRLSSLASGDTKIFDVYDWVFRAWLLQTLRSLPEFADKVSLDDVRLWLAMQRDDILNMLNLHLPDHWNALALALYLTDYPESVVPYIRDIALYETALLETALHLLMSDATTQSVAISSFARLVNTVVWQRCRYSRHCVPRRRSQQHGLKRFSTLRC